MLTANVRRRLNRMASIWSLTAPMHGEFLRSRTWSQMISELMLAVLLTTRLMHILKLASSPVTMQDRVNSELAMKMKVGCEQLHIRKKLTCINSGNYMMDL